MSVFFQKNTHVSQEPLPEGINQVMDASVLSGINMRSEDLWYILLYDFNYVFINYIHAQRYIINFVIIVVVLAAFLGGCSLYIGDKMETFQFTSVHVFVWVQIEAEKPIMPSIMR